MHQARYQPLVVCLNAAACVPILFGLAMAFDVPDWPTAFLFVIGGAMGALQLFALAAIVHLVSLVEVNTSPPKQESQPQSGPSVELPYNPAPAAPLSDEEAKKFLDSLQGAQQVNPGQEASQ